MPREPAELSAMLRVYLTREMCGQPLPPPVPEPALVTDPEAGRPVEGQ